MITKHLALSVLFATWVGMIPGICLAIEPLQVTVSILPQKYLVEKLSGNLVKVSVMVQPGFNPATYEPRPSQMRALVHSKVYFAIGVPFERVWLRKITAVNPKIQVVHTDQSIKKLEMIAHHYKGDEDHKHNDVVYHKASHKRGSLDPHIWLSPPLVKIQARVISEALMMIDPAHKEIYKNNLRKFEIKIGRLDAEIRRIFEDKGLAKEFLVFHPSWGYFAEAYGLHQIPVEIEGKEPSATEMVRLIRYAKEKSIKVIFVQPQFSTKTAETIAREIGAKIVIADPLHEDWMENLLEVAVKLKGAFPKP
jgi:zinc transport system substrate-binding protein